MPGARALRQAGERLSVRAAGGVGAWHGQAASSMRCRCRSASSRIRREECERPAVAARRYPGRVIRDGFAYEVRNRVTLCRCGASKNKPFCDGSHAAIKFRDY